MNLLTVFCRGTVLPSRRVVQPDWVEGRRAPAEAPEPACADSWFDSSWLLSNGLQVTEHSSVATVANDLPLAWWLHGPGAAPARVTMSRGLAGLSPSSRPCR